MANKKKGDHRISSIVITQKQKTWLDKQRDRTGESYNSIVRGLIQSASEKSK